MTNILILLGSFYLLSCLGIYFLQDKLIFFPPMPAEDVYQSVSENEIGFSINDEQVHGWRIKLNPEENKTILYFGGNSEDVVYLNFEAKEFKAYQCITFNYPGYGKTTGKPAQKSLYENALKIYDLAVKEYDLKPQDIVVVGRSLGSSVATYLAAKRKIAGLVLITPFDSIENIAATQYKLLPIKYLIKHRFPTVEYIDDVKAPALMLAAVEDEIIADKNLQHLKKFSGDNHRLVQYDGIGHNTIQTHDNYYAEINDFIKSLPEEEM